MIQFRQKEYTIREGGYTGPKDLEKVPGAASVITKSTLAGLGIGAAAGKVLEDSDMWSGAKIGGKTGFVAGILLKVLLNTLHNPIPKAKFQEVDKAIRREFGVYRVSGFTFGENREKLRKIEEAFVYNDANVTAYKLNVSIQNGKITLYTLGMTDQELDYVSKALDYYCKTYTGWNYHSSQIDMRSNSYSVSIEFTTYETMGQFLVDLAEMLRIRINLLDGRVDVSGKLSEYRIPDIANQNPAEKSFSKVDFDKYEILELLSKGVARRGIAAARVFGPSGLIGGTITGALISGIEKLTNRERALAFGNPLERSEFDNSYLIGTLKKLRYTEGTQYTIGKKDSIANAYLSHGTLILCVANGTKEQKTIDKLYEKLGMTRADIDGKVVLYKYLMKTRREMDIVLQKILDSGVVLNVYRR